QGPTLGKRHCRRNSAGYGGFGVGISDSFFHKDEVSAKTGQLQTDYQQFLHVPLQDIRSQFAIKVAHERSAAWSIP
ncbi:MAG: hypothetical protein WA210_05650, partial [Burkholderiaceae bacterium]